MALWRSVFGGRRAGPKAAPETLVDELLADEQALQALLIRSGFSAAMSPIQNSALPCLDIHFVGPGHNAPIGRSRLGGEPDLPSDVVWPSAPCGSFLSFYGQIDLADPHVSALKMGLPNAGLLSIFIGRFDAALEPAPVAVILSSSELTLKRRQAPAPPEAFHDCNTAHLNPVTVRFERRLSFPPLNEVTADALQTLCPEGDIDALRIALEACPAEILGQWLGYAPSCDDLRETIHFCEIGRQGQERLRLWTSWEGWEQAKTISHRLRNGTIYRPWREQDDDNVRWQQMHRAEIDEGVCRWRSFLTIQSNRHMGLWINDADPVFTFIDAADVAAGDVSRVRAIATQG